MLEEIKILTRLENIKHSISYFGPEISLASLFILLIIFDIFFKRKSPKLLAYLSFTGLLFILIITLCQFDEFSRPENKFLFSKFLHLNQYEIFFKILFLIASLFTIIFTLLNATFKNNENIRGEYYSILVALVLGLNLMVMSSNLLMVYLSIEFVSIASYILVVFNFDKKGAEAGIKYVLFGAFSSGIMLYGMSLLYGLTGNLQFFEPVFLNSLEVVDKLVLLIACLMTVAGFLFKISASPFHVWAPDVYQGGPTPIIAFFSVAPKAAGMAVLINFTYPFYHNHIHDSVVVDWQVVLGVVSVLSLTIGNLAALTQNNAKRLLAYSSIAHAGFILAGLIGFSHFGVRSILFYFSIYLFMNFAAFLLVDIMSHKTGSEDVRNFKGLGIKIPFIGIIFVIVMIALTGLPPTAGFNAKLFVFSALWEAYQESGKHILLFVFVFGLLNTVVALFYYLRIPYYMFFKKAENNMEMVVEAGPKIFLSLLTIPLVALFFKPDWLMNYIDKILLNF